MALLLRPPEVPLVCLVSPTFGSTLLTTDCVDFASGTHLQTLLAIVHAGDDFGLLKTFQRQTHVLARFCPQTQNAPNSRP